MTKTKDKEQNDEAEVQAPVFDGPKVFGIAAFFRKPEPLPEVEAPEQAPEVEMDGGRSHFAIQKERFAKSDSYKLNMLGEEAVAEALAANYGKIALTAIALGVTGLKLRMFIERSKTLPEVQKHLEETIGDQAELGIMRRIFDGNLDAAKFYLQTKERNRGYAARTELTGANGGPIATVVEPDLSALTDQQLAALALTLPQALPAPAGSPGGFSALPIIDAEYTEADDHD
jgi:hypothetical protein